MFMSYFVQVPFGQDPASMKQPEQEPGRGQHISKAISAKSVGLHMSDFTWVKVCLRPPETLGSRPSQLLSPLSRLTKKPHQLPLTLAFYRRGGVQSAVNTASRNCTVITYVRLWNSLFL